MSCKKATVIISNYNYGLFIEEALDSVLQQTYPDVEIIVVDDGSTDNSRDVLMKFKNNERIKILFKENGGQASTINYSLPYIQGKYVFFLDADDFFDSNKIDVCINFFEKYKYDIIYHKLWKVDVTGKKLSIVPPENLINNFSISDVFSERVPLPSMSGICLKKEVLEQICPIPENLFFIRADFYLQLIVSFLNFNIGVINQPLSYYRIHGKNLYAGFLTEEKIKKDVIFLERVYDFLKNKFEIPFSLYENYNYLRNKIYLTAIKNKKQSIFLFCKYANVTLKSKKISLIRRFRRYLTLLIFAVAPSFGLKFFNLIRK